MVCVLLENNSAYACSLHTFKSSMHFLHLLPCLEQFGFPDRFPEISEKGLQEDPVKVQAKDS